LTKNKFKIGDLVLMSTTEETQIVGFIYDKISGTDSYKIYYIFQGAAYQDQFDEYTLSRLCERYEKKHGKT
jgi:hypothetical protein